METLRDPTPAAALRNSYSQPPSTPAAPIMEANNGPMGFINLAILDRSIIEVLRETKNSDDAELADWLDATYLQPPAEPDEESREINSSEDFQKLFTAYNRVKNVTNRAQPEKWPFFDARLREMSRAKVKEKVRSSASDKAEERPAVATGDTAAANVSAQPAIKEPITKKLAEETLGGASSPGVLDMSSFTPVNRPTVDNITMTAALSDPVVTNLDSRPGSAISTNKRKSMTPIAGDQKVKRPRGWNLRGGKAHALTRAQAEAEGETGDFETEPTTEGDKGGNGRLTKKPKKRTSGTSKAQAEVAENYTPRRSTRKSRVQEVKDEVEEETSETETQYPTTAVAPLEEEDVAGPTLPIALTIPPRDSVSSEPLSGRSTEATSGDIFQVSPMTSMREDSIAGQDATVTFFARVQKAGVTTEIPLPLETLVRDAQLVDPYVEYLKQTGDTDMTFRQFVNVSDFAGRR